jgi:hypothetical protein
VSALTDALHLWTASSAAIAHRDRAASQSAARIRTASESLHALLLATARPCHVEVQPSALNRWETGPATALHAELAQLRAGRDHLFMERSHATVCTSDPKPARELAEGAVPHTADLAAPHAVERAAVREMARFRWLADDDAALRTQFPTANETVRLYREPACVTLGCSGGGGAESPAPMLVSSAALDTCWAEARSAALEEATRLRAELSAATAAGESAQEEARRLSEELRRLRLDAAEAVPLARFEAVVAEAARLRAELSAVVSAAAARAEAEAEASLLEAQRLNRGVAGLGGVVDADVATPPRVVAAAMAARVTAPAAEAVGGSRVLASCAATTAHPQVGVKAPLLSKTRAAPAAAPDNDKGVEAGAWAGAACGADAADECDDDFELFGPGTRALAARRGLPAPPDDESASSDADGSAAEAQGAVDAAGDVGYDFELFGPEGTPPRPATPHGAAATGGGGGGGGGDDRLERFDSSAGPATARSVFDAAGGGGAPGGGVDVGTGSGAGLISNGSPRAAGLDAAPLGGIVGEGPATPVMVDAEVQTGPGSWLGAAGHDAARAEAAGLRAGLEAAARVAAEGAAAAAAARAEAAESRAEAARLAEEAARLRRQLQSMVTRAEADALRDELRMLRNALGSGARYTMHTMLGREAAAVQVCAAATPHNLFTYGHLPLSRSPSFRHCVVPPCLSLPRPPSSFPHRFHRTALNPLALRSGVKVSCHRVTVARERMAHAALRHPCLYLVPPPPGSWQARLISPLPCRLPPAAPSIQPRRPPQ